jgi:hypothetical protein
LPFLLKSICFYVIIENQLAEDNPKETRLTLERLFEEGLHRHDALHALPWALSESMNGAMKNPTKQQNIMEQYIHSLKSLTAKKWLRSVEEEKF